jgi:DNA-directed RNA polymerase specialized sigma24 family protein
MQDAFLSVWERWDRVGAKAAPRAYLYPTAMNQFPTRCRGPPVPRGGGWSM